MVCSKCKEEIPDISIYCIFCGKKPLPYVRKQKVKSRGNSQGSAYFDKSTKSWRAAVTVSYKTGADGKKRPERKTVSGFKTKRDALEYLDELKEAVAKKTITVHELYQAIQPKIEKLSLSRRNSYTIAYKSLIPIEHTDIDKLSIKDLQKCVDDKKAGFSSKRNIKDLLFKMYEYAHADGKVDRNLAQYIELPPNIQKTQKVVFSNHDIARLWDAWDNGDEFAGYILIITYCALRTGELRSIKTADVDFDKHIMTGGIKNNMGKFAPIFIIPIIEPVIKYFVDKYPDDCFYNKTFAAFYQQWRGFSKKMGFREEITPYSGRHTCATLLANAGVPEAVIMKITRHEKYDTTLRYTHIDIDSALSKMTAAFDSETRLL